jgi:hypothetical protein
MKRELENVKEFEYLLNEETWQEMFLGYKVYAKFNVFMNALHWFDIVFL